MIVNNTSQASSSASGQSASQPAQASGNEAFANILRQTLSFARLQQMAGMQHMMGAGAAGPYRHPFAAVGNFMPGLAGLSYGASPLAPVTNFNFNFFGIPGASESGESSGITELLASLDLSKFPLESVTGSASESGTAGLSELSGVARSTAALEIPQSPEELAAKLADQLVKLQENGDTTLNATAQHPVYGPISVEVAIKGEQVSLAVTTSDAAVHDALQAAAASLGSELEGHGLSLASMDVQLDPNHLNLLANGALPVYPSISSVSSVYMAVTNLNSPMGLINGTS